MFDEVLDLLFGFRKPGLVIRAKPLPVAELPRPSLLSFSLITGDGRPCVPLVKQGESVSPGQFLGDDGTRQVLACPVAGKVAGVTSAPDLRGTSSGPAVLVEPEGDGAAFATLDPDKEPVASLWDRIDQAGVVTDSQAPRPLAEVAGPRAGVDIETLVVLAADREPEVAAQVTLLDTRGPDAVAAARMLGRISGAKKVLLAVPAPLVRTVGSGVPIMPIPIDYPQSLEPMVALRAGGGEKTRVVALETALAALDAVREGKVQNTKLVTFIGPEGMARKNLLVHLGTRLKDLFPALGMKPRDRDKVVAGGPMRGFAQYSLDASVDQGMDAVMLIPSESQVPWTDDPCASCGACVSVCPVNLQANLLGRYAEFSLFDRAEEYGVMYCIECGLCAYVCTGRRPLVQLIRLARREVEKKRMAAQVAETAACEASEDAGQAGEAASGPSGS